MSAKRLRVTPYSLYQWRKQFGRSESQVRAAVDQRHGSNGGVSPVEFEARFAQSGS